MIYIFPKKDSDYSLREKHKRDQIICHIITMLMWQIKYLLLIYARIMSLAVLRYRHIIDGFVTDSIYFVYISSNFVIGKTTLLQDYMKYSSRISFSIRQICDVSHKTSASSQLECFLLYNITILWIYIML